MKMTMLLAPLVFGIFSVPVAAAGISSHVLDLANGVGGADVPVTLSRRDATGSWVIAGEARTDANGRVRSFNTAQQFDPGIYRLQFAQVCFSRNGQHAR